MVDIIIPGDINDANPTPARLRDAMTDTVRWPEDFSARARDLSTEVSGLVHKLTTGQEQISTPENLRVVIRQEPQGSNTLEMFQHGRPLDDGCRVVELIHCRYEALASTGRVRFFDCWGTMVGDFSMTSLVSVEGERSGSYWYSPVYWNARL